MTNRHPDIRWLAAGAVLGLAAAAIGVLDRSAPASLPDEAVARVNDTLIARTTVQRARERLGIDAADEGRLLAQLIDDELLVQRGIELGMTESDSEVRNAIVNSLVASITAEADAASPDDGELGRYLADNAARFSYTARLAVDAWETEREPLAQAFVSALREGTALPDDAAIRPMPDLPSGMMEIDALRDYLGPAIAAAAAEMPDGSSAVFARRGRWLVVRVTGRERSTVTDLAAIRNRVLLDYRRTLADRLLRDYVDGLRQRADIVTARP